jgi:D-alanyl-D-alanine dipeptidase
MRVRPGSRVGALAVAALFLVAVALPQPHERGPFRPADLVELTRLDSTLRLDIRYATSNNFMHRPMYDEARAFLQRPAAEALIRVQKKLKPLGYGLLIFDGYRPWSVTKKFWDETPSGKRAFVADPAKGSRHNRGCAVDLSMVDLGTGKEVPMITPYDDFTEKAAARYPSGTPQQRAARDLLRRTMASEGFRVEPNEWWHFDFREWRHYRIMNVPFTEIHP